MECPVHCHCCWMTKQNHCRYQSRCRNPVNRAAHVCLEILTFLRTKSKTLSLKIHDSDTSSLDGFILVVCVSCFLGITMLSVSSSESSVRTKEAPQLMKLYIRLFTLFLYRFDKTCQQGLAIGHSDKQPRQTS